jgi:hypothetical protein
MQLLLLTVLGVAGKVEALAEWTDRGLSSGRSGRGRVAMPTGCFGEHDGHAGCERDKCASIDCGGAINGGRAYATQRAGGGRFDRSLKSCFTNARSMRVCKRSRAI